MEDLSEKFFEKKLLPSISSFYCGSFEPSVTCVTLDFTEIISPPFQALIRTQGTISSVGTFSVIGELANYEKAAQKAKRKNFTFLYKPFGTSVKNGYFQVTWAILGL